MQLLHCCQGGHFVPKTPAPAHPVFLVETSWGTVAVHAAVEVTAIVDLTVIALTQFPVTV